MQESIFWIKFDADTLRHSDICFQEQNIRIGKETIIGVGTTIMSSVVIKDNVTIGKNCIIGNFTLIREGVIIGDNVKIGSHNSIEPHASIGSQTRTQGHCMISEHSKIGCDVFLGPYFNNPADNTIGQPIGEYKPNPAIVMDNVRIGSKVVITPGNVIGEGCIIGAGSVVTKDTTPHYLYYGNPAKKIRKVEE